MDPQRKSSIKSYGSNNSSSRSGSFDFDQDNRREVVVKIDSEPPRVPIDSHVSGPSSNYGSTSNTPRAVLTGSGDGSSASSGSPSRAGIHRDGAGSFSFKNRLPQSPTSPAPITGGDSDDDPPNRLIGNFLRKQAAAGGEMSLDPADFDLEDLRRPTTRAPPASVSPSREQYRVSFQDASKRYNASSSSSASSSYDGCDDNRKQSGTTDGDTGELLRCKSTSTSSMLGRNKTRSRLMDPPPPSVVGPGGEADRKSFVAGKGQPPKSGQLRSGLITKSGLILKSGQIGKSGPVGKSGPIGKSGPFDNEEEDDPFIDEGVTSDLKRETMDCLLILEWVSLILIVGALVCSLTVHELSQKRISGLPLWRWELLLFVLICGRLVSGWVVRIAVFFVERIFLLRKKVLYFVYGMRRAVRNVLWLGVALISWHFLFDKNAQRHSHTLVLPYVTKVLCCLLVATVIRLIKTLLLKVLASSFHVSTYFDRIQDALFNQYAIETLSGPPLVDESRMLAEVQRLQGAGAAIPSELQETAIPNKSGPVPKQSGRLTTTTSTSKRGGASKQLLQRQKTERQMDEGISMQQLHKLSQKNISAWSMKRLMKIVRYGALTTMDEQIKHATGKGDELATQIHSEHEAKVAAKRIFLNVAKPGSKYIYLQDLMRFMRQEEALKAMDLFEGAQEHNRVSRRALKNWVVSAFRERKALALTLNDTKTAVNKLHQMANVVVALIVLALWLLILEIATTRFFVFLSSQLLVAVFMFGNTLKTIFEAIIFLFVMHPFDVGDRCEVDGMQVVVEEMNIMTTLFLRYDNLKVYYPNSKLAVLPIMNYYRSPDMGDAVDFTVHVATPVEKLALMKERLLHYLDNKKEHWYPGSMVVLRDVDDTNKLRVSIWCRHTINFHDMGLRFERRELLLQEMIKILKDLDIEYRMLPLDVNIRSAPPIQSSRMPSTWVTTY